MEWCEEFKKETEGFRIIKLSLSRTHGWSYVSDM